MGSIPVADFRLLGGFSENLDFGAGGGVCGLVASSLALDGDRGELVRVPSRSGKKGGGGGGSGGGGGGGGGSSGGGLSDVKAALALKSHSEAERKRRERINSHLATLRSLLPSTTKMDKAALLSEVITQLKEHKSRATEISKSFSVPSDTDGVKVESFGGDPGGGNFLMKASLCCEDRPDLISDLKQSLQSLNMRIVNAEISTLGGRVMTTFVMAREGSNTYGIEKHLLMSSVHQTLKAVLDRVCCQAEFTAETPFSGKRRRLLHFDCSSSSS